MKKYSSLFILFSLAFSTQVASKEIHNPDHTLLSAKYAKIKSKQTALETQANAVIQTIDSTLDSSPGSCDLNIGNVIIDDVDNAPDDVVIIIEGDILQSNNCR